MDSDFPTFELVSAGLDARPNLRFRALSLDTEIPARMALLLTEGERGSFASTIAMQRAVDVMLDALLAADAADSRGLMQQALKAANDAIYGYSERMSVPGQLWARVLAGVFDGRNFTLARVGDYQAWLGRGGELLPAFADDAAAGELRLGAAPQVAVDLATMRLEDNDLLLLSAGAAPLDFAARAADTLRSATRMQDAALRLSAISEPGLALLRFSA